jgi:hypothetical protein
MVCSCPEINQPCKHIAALWVKLTEEINTNPSILFTLRGINLEEIFNKAGEIITDKSKIEEDTTSTVVYYDYFEPNPLKDGSLISLSIPKLNFRKNPTEQFLTQVKAFHNDKEADKYLEAINGFYNYLSISVNDDTTLTEAEYSIIAKNKIQLLFDDSKDYFEITPFVDDYQSLEEAGFLSIEEVQNKVIEFPIKKGDDTYGLSKLSMYEIPTQSFILTLQHLPLFFDGESSTEMRFWAFAGSITTSLIKARAFIPYIHPLENNGFMIIYKPLLLHHDIITAVEHLKEIMPYNLAYRPFDTKVMDNKGITHILSYLLTAYIANKGEGYEHPLPIEVGSALFEGKLYQPKNIEEQTKGKFIADLLKPLKLDIDGFAYHLELFQDENDEDSLKLSLDVSNILYPEVPRRRLNVLLDTKEGAFDMGIRKLSRRIKNQLFYIEQIFKNIPKLYQSDYIVLKKSDFYNTYREHKDIFNTLGIENIFHDGLPNFANPTMYATIQEEEQGDYALDIHLRLAEEEVLFRDFIQIAMKSNYPVYNNNIINADNENIVFIQELLASSPIKVTYTDAIKIALTNNYKGVDIPDTTIYNNLINRIRKIRSAPLKENELATLKVENTEILNKIYHYFSQDLNFIFNGAELSNYQNHLIAGLISSDMEKTFTYPNLYISTEDNVKKLQKFIHGQFNGYNCVLFNRVEVLDIFTETDIYLVTYDYFRKNIELFVDLQFATTIIDNQVNILNYKVFKGIQSTTKCIVSKEDFSTDLSTLYYNMDCIYPDYFEDYNTFWSNYGLLINKFRDSKQKQLLLSLINDFII